MVASPAFLADDGADEPINVLTKILLDKNERLKEGRDILYEPKFTQVGIAYEVFDEEDMVILIFAIKFIDDEPDFELPKGDLHWIEKGFRYILDPLGKQKTRCEKNYEIFRWCSFIAFKKVYQIKILELGLNLQHTQMQRWLIEKQRKY